MARCCQRAKPMQKAPVPGPAWGVLRRRRGVRNSARLRWCQLVRANMGEHMTQLMHPRLTFACELDPARLAALFADASVIADLQALGARHRAHAL